MNGDAASRLLVVFGFAAGYILGDIWIGLRFLAFGLWGWGIFLSSFLFFIGFLALASKKFEEIKGGELEINRAVVSIFLVVAVFLAYLGVAKIPPSLFLFSLFFVFLTLAITWVWYFQVRTLTVVSVGLIALACLPIVTGLVYSNEEDKLRSSLDQFDGRVKYYDSNFENITNSILTKDHTETIRHDLEVLRADVAGVKNDILSGDLGSAGDKLKDAQLVNDRLDRYFKQINIKEGLFDLLRATDDSINKLNQSAQTVTTSEYCTNATVDKIRSDIELIRTDTDLAWETYRQGAFQTTNDMIQGLDVRIAEVKNRVERCRLVSTMAPTPTPQPGPPVIVIILCILAAFLIYGRRRN
jgi:hypothetical protein